MPQNMISLKRVLKVRGDFYDTDIARKPPAVNPMGDIFTEVDRFLARYIDRCSDSETVRHLTVVRVSLNALFAKYRSRVIFNFNSITNHALAEIKDFISAFFERYGNKNICIDDEGFRTIFEPIMMVYVNHDGLVLNTINSILGGEQDDRDTSTKTP